MNDINKSPAPLQSGKPDFRWGRVLLFVSLALNFAVLGIIGGAVMGRFGPDRGNIAAREVGFGFFTEALSDQDRKDLRRAYGQVRPDIRADRRQMREDLQRVVDLLRATPFDAEALRSSLDAGVSRIRERQELGQTIILDHLSKMTAEERVAFADRLENSLKRQPRGDLRPGRERN
jgi:uncharacterized membrane protein